MNDYLSLVLQSKLFEGFSRLDCKIMYSLLQPRWMNFSKNEVIVNEGDIVDFIGIVRIGRIISAKFDYEGNVNLMEILECPMSLCTEVVFTTSRISPITITSAEDSTILVFSYARFMESLPDKYRVKMLNNINHILANDNVRKMYKINVLSKKSLRDKILMYLYLMKKKTGKSSFEIRMNREQFAQYLCVNRSALSHELAIMRKEGLISFNKDMFTICKNNTRNK